MHSQATDPSLILLGNLGSQCSSSPQGWPVALTWGTYPPNSCQSLGKAVAEQAC